MIIDVGVLQSIDTNNVNISGAWLWSSDPVYDSTYTEELTQPISVEASTLMELRFTAAVVTLTIRQTTDPMSKVLWSGVVETVQDPVVAQSSDVTIKSAGVADPVPPVFTDLGSGSFSIAACNVNLYATPNYVGTIDTYAVASASFTLTSGLEQYLCVRYNDGAPVYYLESNNALITGSDSIAVYVMWLATTGPGGALEIHSVSLDSRGIGLPNKVADMMTRTQPYTITYNQHLTLNETATPVVRTVLISGAVVYAGVDPINVLALNSSVAGNRLTRVNHVAGVWTYTNDTQYDNQNYDNGTNLVALGANRYSVRWFYRSIGDDIQCFYTCSGNYSNIAGAEADPVPTGLPPILQDHCVLIGRMIIQQGVDTAIAVENVATTTFQSQAVTVHNSLNGLQGNGTDYYHLDATEYSRVSGSYWLPLTGGTLTGSLTSRGVFSNSFAGDYAFRAYTAGDTLLRWGVDNAGQICWGNGAGLAGSILAWDQATGTLKVSNTPMLASGYKVTGGTSSQFLKGDGTLDSTAYAPATGGSYLPLAGGTTTGTVVGSVTLGTGYGGPYAFQASSATKTGISLFNSTNTANSSTFALTYDNSRQFFLGAVDTTGYMSTAMNALVDTSGNVTAVYLGNTSGSFSRVYIGSGSGTLQAGTIYANNIDQTGSYYNHQTSGGFPNSAFMNGGNLQLQGSNGTGSLQIYGQVGADTAGAAPYFYFAGSNVGVTTTGGGMMFQFNSTNGVDIYSWNNTAWVKKSTIKSTGTIATIGGTSSQFLKADGSIDSTAYAPATGGSYLPLTGGTLTGTLFISGAAGTTRTLAFQTSGVSRWFVRAGSDAETGSNAGSIFEIVARDDAGATIDVPVQITRAAGGAISLNRPTTILNNNLIINQTAGSATLYLTSAGTSTESSIQWSAPSTLWLLGNRNGISGVPNTALTLWSPASGGTAYWWQSTTLFQHNTNVAASGTITATGAVSAGTAQMSTWVTTGTYARFGHSSWNASSGFGYLQNNDGNVYIEAPTSTTVNLRIAGTGVVQVAAGTCTITGTLTSSGVIQYGNNSAGSGGFIANHANGNTGYYAIQIGGFSRWLLRDNNVAADDFAVAAYNSTGTFIDNALLIANAAGGNVTFGANRGVYATGRMQAANAAMATWAPDSTYSWFGYNTQNNNTNGYSGILHRNDGTMVIYSPTGKSTYLGIGTSTVVQLSAGAVAITGNVTTNGGTNTTAYINAGQGTNIGAAIYPWQSEPRNAVFSHANFIGVPASYAFLQTWLGATYINAPTGNNIGLQINNVDVGSVNTIGIRAGMGTNIGAAIFPWAGGNTVACFGHQLFATTAGSFSIAQNSAGGTTVNSVSGQTTWFTINNSTSTAMTWDGSWLQLGTSSASGRLRSYYSGTQASLIGNWPANNWWGIGSDGSTTGGLGVVRVGMTDVNGGWFSNSVTLAVLGNIKTDSGIIGFKDASNAGPGIVGEYVSTSIASGSGAVTLTSGTVTVIMSISLTAGDWDVTATALMGSTQTVQGTALADITSSTTTIGSDGYNGLSYMVTGTGVKTQVTCCRRINISTTTTINLLAQLLGTYTSGACWGNIQARRAR